MTVVSKTALKAYFTNGRVPNEAHYIDLIDSLFGGADYIDIKDISVPGTPASGFGRLYINSDNIDFKRDDGTIIPLSVNKKFLRSPIDPYGTEIFSFKQNDFANNHADFSDSANPYSFGGSPGGFGLYAPSGVTARSDIHRHHLFMNGGGGNLGGVSWNNGTGVSNFWVLMALRGWHRTVDTLIGGIRWWGVTPPTATDKYYEIRFKNTPQSGLMLSFFYGTGLTYSLTDGTGSGYWFPINTDHYLFQCSANAGPVGSMTASNPRNRLVAEYQAGNPAGWPTTIKYVFIYNMPDTWSAYLIDTMTTTVEGAIL